MKKFKGKNDVTDIIMKNWLIDTIFFQNESNDLSDFIGKNEAKMMRQ